MIRAPAVCSGIGADLPLGLAVRSSNQEQMQWGWGAAMGVSPSNVVRLQRREWRQASMLAVPITAPSYDQTSAGNDLQSLEILSAGLAILKETLVQAIANFSQACVAAGQPNPQVQLRTLLRPVETLEAGMHRLAGAITAQLPR